MTRRDIISATFLFAGTLVLGGCAYRTGSLIPAGVRSVHVAVVANKTFWREAVKTDNLDPAAPLATPRPAFPMERDLTERIKNEIVRRTPLALARRAEADSILTASIVKVRPRTLFRDAADELLAQRVNIEVDFEWTDRRTGRVLARGRGVKRPTDFIVARGQNFTTAARRSFDYIAERIVEGMQEEF